MSAQTLGGEPGSDAVAADSQQRWRSVTFTVDDGQLTGLSDELGGLLADRVRLSLADPWVAEDAEPLTWRIDRPDGAAELVAEWQLVDGELRLTMVLTSSLVLEVPGPLLTVESTWPQQRLRLGPRNSALLIETHRPDGAVLLLAAHHRAGDWGHCLDGSPMLLAATRLPRQLGWQARWSPAPDALAAVVPSWLPKLSVEAGDEFELALPDAGVVAQTLTVDSSERGAVLAVPSGRHHLQVHQQRGTTSFSVWGRPLDPPQPTSAAGRALAGLNSQFEGGVELAEHELEEALHQSGEVSPLLLCAVAALVSQTGLTHHRDLLLEALPRLATAPGRVLAQVRAAVALVMAGDRAAAIRVGVADWTTDDPVLDICLRAEAAVLTGATVPTVEVRAMCGLWGRGLPVDELALEWVAPWTVVWRHAPESWRVDDGWLLDQAQVLEWARVRVQLDHPGHPAADWLLM